MTAKAEIFAALRGLVADRVYPGVAPLNTGRPYITYQKVGGSSINFLKQEIPNKKNGRFQIAVWGITRSEVDSLGNQVESILRMRESLQTTVLTEQIDVYEEETKLNGTRQDFSFWTTP